MLRKIKPVQIKPGYYTSGYSTRSKQSNLWIKITVYFFLTGMFFFAFFRLCFIMAFVSFDWFL